MRRRSFSSLASASIALAFAVAIAFAPTEARAESSPAPPRCSVSLLPTATMVPASLPALVIENTSSPGLNPVVTIDSITSGLTLGTIPDPRTPGTNLLVAAKTSPMEIGKKYEFNYTVTCENFHGAPPKTASAGFTTGEATLLPTTIGTVKQLGGAKPW